MRTVSPELRRRNAVSTMLTDSELAGLKRLAEENRTTIGGAIGLVISSLLLADDRDRLATER